MNRRSFFGVMAGASACAAATELPAPTYVRPPEQGSDLCYVSCGGMAWVVKRDLKAGEIAVILPEELFEAYLSRHHATNMRLLP